MQEIKKVCDGCWKRGVCTGDAFERSNATRTPCTCPCVPEGWMHTDNPLNPRSKNA